MTTVLRVRRKRLTDPAESLVFSSSKKSRNVDGTAAERDGTAAAGTACKGPAGGTVGGDSDKKVFRFAGTVGRKDEPIAKQIKEAIKKSTSQPTTTTTPVTTAKPKKKSTNSKCKSTSSKAREKSRSAQQELSQARRYQVIAGHRGIDLNELDTAPSQTATTTKKVAPVKRTPSKLKIWNRLTSHQKKAAAVAEASPEDETSKPFCLYDVVQDDSVPAANKQTQPKSPEQSNDSTNPDVILCNSVQMVREKLVIDDKLQETDFVYDLYYIEEGQLDLDPSSPTSEAELLCEYLARETEHDVQETYEDDSDSNDEGNWRNDYPEDEPDKRHPDLFDELIDDYCYGDQSSEEDFGEYAESKKLAGNHKSDYNAHGGSGDDLDCYA